LTFYTFVLFLFIKFNRMSTKTAVTNESILGSKSSSQVYNPATGNYILRDGLSGKFTKISHGKPFRGIRKEFELADVVRLSIPKRVALKAERAVIALRNGEL
jgi:hypothetical protein